MSGVIARLALARPGFTLALDLALPGRGVSALFGPSGSGKTTCLRAIAGLERAPGGFVQVNDAVWQDDARGIFVPTHQRALGYVFQEASLFAHLDVRRNLEYGMRRIAPAQRRVPLEQAVALLGIAPLMTRRPDTLSGGERQRVGIARALATSPQILLMDEPLAALDAARKAEIMPYLERLHDQLRIPILYVSHAIDEVAQLADHMVLLSEGRAQAAGPIGELLTRLDLPLAHGDAAAALVVATVCGHDSTFNLTSAEFAGGRLSLPQQSAGIGQQVRIRVQARDVSLSLAAPRDTSILNSIAVTISDLADDGASQVMVGLDAAGTRLLARITRKSAVALQLAAGMRVHAQIKGVAILK